MEERKKDKKGTKTEGNTERRAEEETAKHSQQPY